MEKYVLSNFFVSFQQILLQHFQIGYENTAFFRELISHIKFFQTKAFSAAFLCSVPKFQQSAEGQIIQCIPMCII